MHTMCIQVSMFSESVAMQEDAVKTVPAAEAPAPAK